VESWQSLARRVGMPSDSSAAVEPRFSGGRTAARMLLVILFVAGSVLPALSVSALDLEQKREWQGRYRALRIQVARLELTADLATKEYADANRRNYRRSGVRHFHRENALRARVEAERVRKELGQLKETARAAGLPRSWFDEVDEEPIDRSRIQALGDYREEGRFMGEGAPAEDGPGGVPASSTGSFDDGRNPLYETSSPSSDANRPLDERPYTYEEWLKSDQAGSGDEPS
jgi:hypothetical protein